MHDEKTHIENKSTSGHFDCPFAFAFALFLAKPSRTTKQLLEHSEVLIRSFNKSRSEYGSHTGDCRRVKFCDPCAPLRENKKNHENPLGTGYQYSVTRTHPKVLISVISSLLILRCRFTDRSNLIYQVLTMKSSQSCSLNVHCQDLVFSSHCFRCIF